jgi:hypothetical protein
MLHLYNDDSCTEELGDSDPVPSEITPEFGLVVDTTTILP